MPILEQWERGYLAGYLDADGGIIIRPQANKYSFQVYLRFVGTKDRMLNLHGIVGEGNIYQHGGRWNFQIGTRKVLENIFKKIYPYTTKKREIEIVYELWKLFDENNGKPSVENVKRRIKLFKEYKSLKCRSGGHDINWGEFEESLWYSYYNGSAVYLSDKQQELSRQRALRNYHRKKLDADIAAMSDEEKKELLRRLCYGDHEPSLDGVEEGVETSPEIMDGSAPPEREEIVRACGKP
jgi:hypothetical protein